VYIILFYLLMQTAMKCTTGVNNNSVNLLGQAGFLGCCTKGKRPQAA